MWYLKKKKKKWKGWALLQVFALLFSSFVVLQPKSDVFAEGEKHIIAHAQYNPAVQEHHQDQIDGSGWVIGDWITLEVDDPGTPENPDYIEEQEAHLTEVEFITVSFLLGDFDLLPGHVITMSDGAYSTTHVVKSQAITSVDAVNDKIYGTAPPGKQVEIWFEQPDNHNLLVTADGSGLWEADFSGIADIAYGTSGAAAMTDNPESASHTRWNWNFEETHIEASLTYDWIDFYWFTPFETVTLELFDSPENGGGLLHTETFDLSPDGDYHFEWGEIGDLIPGMKLRATDDASGLVKELVLKYLEVDEFDPDGGVITGMSDPFVDVEVILYSEFDEEDRQVVIADETGYWEAGFGSFPQDWGSAAKIFDDEQDATDAEYVFPPLPIVQVFLNRNSIELWDFTPDDDVNVKVYETRIGDLLIDHTLTVDGGGWEWIEVAEFGIVLQPDMFITAEELATGIVKELELVDLAVDGVDFEADTMWGYAPPEAHLVVGVFGEEDLFEIEVFSDPDGLWYAEFASEFDILEGMLGMVWHDDEDGDLTGFEQLGEEGPFPFVVGQANVDRIYVVVWEDGADVTIIVDDDYDPGNGILYTETQTFMSPPPFYLFDLAGVFDLQTGHIITATDGETTKTLLLASIEITDVDVDSDVVSGFALPDDKVFVWVGEGINVVDETGPDGSWSVDFTGLYDIQYGDAVSADQPDDDEDLSSFQWTPEHYNTPPEITSVAAPVDPVEVGTEVTATASFTDSNPGDSHSSSWDWGDGNVTDGAVADGESIGMHTYNTPGVYTLKASVEDDKGAQDEKVYRYVVVYDPDGGFVTGGGWINSPEGAYAANPSLTGKASFGFVSKYKKGANLPTGNTEFHFKAGGMKFNSSSYDWLVVAGKQAKFKGVGKINGEGGYGFMLSCRDGDLKNGDGIDRFRIKIWDRATDTVVYDNQMGESDDSDPATELGGGSIVIHKAK